MAKILTGEVSSNKPDKTIVVAVKTHKIHPVYKKRYSIAKKFMAHDKNNEAKVGDKVQIIECKPISARKRYMLSNIIEKATVKHVEPAEEVQKETV